MAISGSMLVGIEVSVAGREPVQEQPTWRIMEHTPAATVKSGESRAAREKRS